MFFTSETIFPKVKKENIYFLKTFPEYTFPFYVYGKTFPEVYFYTSKKVVLEVNFYTSRRPFQNTLIFFTIPERSFQKYKN